MEYSMYILGCDSVAVINSNKKRRNNDNDKVNGLCCKILRDFSKYWGDS